MLKLSHDSIHRKNQNIAKKEEKNHDTMVILEHFLKNIGIYFTLLSWSFFQKKYTKITSILWCSNDF